MPRLTDHNIRLNLRELDLELIYKFIPENIKSSVLPKTQSLNNLRENCDVLAKALEDKRAKRSGLLRAKIEPNHWALVRWGQGTKLGKTFLGVLKELPKGPSVLFWTKQGNYYIPLWWIEKLYTKEELQPVQSWQSPRLPNLPENHPANLDLKNLVEDGFYERLLTDSRAVATAARTDFLNWSSDQRTLYNKLKTLNEDQIAALYYKNQKSRLKLEKDRLERLNLDRLARGSWLVVKPDRVSTSYPVALVEYLPEKDSAIVWNPDIDDMEEIPVIWVQRIDVQRKRVRIDQDKIAEEDRLAHSEPYRLKQVQVTEEEIKTKILQKCLAEQLSATMPWTTLWTAHNKNFHKLVRERGQALLNWFSRWKDPVLPNEESFTHLEYNTGSPLIVLITLSFVSDGERVADFLRAEVDLFEGTVRAKDPALAKALRELV